MTERRITALGFGSFQELFKSTCVLDAIKKTKQNGSCHKTWKCVRFINYLQNLPSIFQRRVHV